MARNVSLSLWFDYLCKVTGSVAPPPVPRRRHSDPESVAHEPVADVLSCTNVGHDVTLPIPHDRDQIVGLNCLISTFSLRARKKSQERLTKLQEDASATESGFGALRALVAAPQFLQDRQPQDVTLPCLSHHVIG